jgi:hypothetical protein
VRLTLRFGIDTIPDTTKDKVIAPKISKLHAPRIPEIGAEKKHLLGAFILNFDLYDRLSNKQRQLLFNVIRKAEDTLYEYGRAAESLKLFITNREFRVEHYFSAIRYFEHCLAHLHQSVCCLNALSKTFGGPQQYEYGDGSTLERVRLIHNWINTRNSQTELSQKNPPFAFLQQSKTEHQL